MSVVPAEDKAVTLFYNGREYHIDDVRAIATNLITQWAADMGFIEWSVDDDGQVVFIPLMCCDHDCAVHEDD